MILFGTKSRGRKGEDYRMARSSGMGLRRDLPLPLYLSRAEKVALKKSAKAAGLSMVEYVRCKTFDYPIHVLNGKKPNGHHAHAEKK